MLIGYIIEIMILKETIFATQIELFQNQDRWHEVKNFYLAINELQQFIGKIREGEVPLLPSPVENEVEEVSETASPPEDDKTLLLLGELRTLLEGNALSPSLNGQAKGKK